MTVRSAGWFVVLVMLGACTEAGGEQPGALCQRYAEAAERVLVSGYPVHVPTITEFYVSGGAYAMDYAPEVESRCSWRELNLVVEFAEVAEYFDPEIMLGSVLDDLRRTEGLDAYADRMRIVLEDRDSGLYAAFDPRD